MLFKIIQNNIPETDFELLNVESDAFTFTDDVTGDEIGDGVILLKIILDDVKRSTVIDVQGLGEKVATGQADKARKSRSNLYSRDVEIVQGNQKVEAGNLR